MDVHYYDSMREFERCEASELPHDNEVTIIRDGKWLLADASIADGDYRKIINDFFKALSLYPEYDGWEKRIKDNVNDGLFSNSDTYIGNHKSNPNRSFAWAIEYDEDRSYIFLNFKVDQYDER